LLSDTVDLDAYFSRIGYAGPRTATLDCLRALHVLHPSAIAFENLDPVLGRPVPLDAASLERKLIHEGRGGYCFEHNTLFLRVLEALGFSVTGLSARVLNGRLERDSPRSHMLLKVDLNGEAYIADVGFGSLTLTAPLRLYETAEQETPHGVFRLVPSGEEFEEQAPGNVATSLKNGAQSAPGGVAANQTIGRSAPGGEGWRTLYRFSLQKNFMQDFEAPNWFRATHPDSPFVKNLMAARPLADRRLGMFNNRFTIRYLDGRIEKRMLETGREMADVLQDQFGIKLPEPRSEVEAGLARLIRV